MSLKSSYLCVIDKPHAVPFLASQYVHIYIKYSLRNSIPITYPVRFLNVKDMDCGSWAFDIPWGEYLTWALPVILQKSCWLQGGGFLLLFPWAAAHFRLVYGFKRKICHCFEHIKAHTLRTFSSCILVFRIQSLCAGMLSGHMVGLPLIVSSINCRTISSLSIDLVCIWWWEVEAEITEEKWHFCKWDALKILPLFLVISNVYVSMGQLLTCVVPQGVKHFYFRSLPQ